MIIFNKQTKVDVTIPFEYTDGHYRLQEADISHDICLATFETTPQLMHRRLAHHYHHEHSSTPCIICAAAKGMKTVSRNDFSSWQNGKVGA